MEEPEILITPLSQQAPWKKEEDPLRLKRKDFTLGYLSLAEKRVIISNYLRCLNKVPAPGKLAAAKEVVNIVGVTRQTVWRVINEYEKTGTIKEPVRRGGRPKKINGDKLQSFVIKATKVLHQTNTKPSLRNLHEKINELGCEISKSTVNSYLQKMDFKDEETAAIIENHRKQIRKPPEEKPQKKPAPKLGENDCLPSCKFKCKEIINETERKKIKNKYCSLANITDKDSFILNTSERTFTKKLISENATFNEATRPRKVFSFRYYFLVNEQKVQVCQQFYLGTLVITRQRIYSAYSGRFKMVETQDPAKMVQVIMETEDKSMQNT